MLRYDDCCAGTQSTPLGIFDVNTRLPSASCGSVLTFAWNVEVDVPAPLAAPLQREQPLLVLAVRCTVVLPLESR